jgi:membrane associated rhomboid family serine protease
MGINIKEEISIKRAALYGFFILLSMWLVYWADALFSFNFHELGVLPKQLKGLKGILFMPLIHASDDSKHILNNSPAIFFLSTLLFYSYHKIALKVFMLSWILSGLLLWSFAQDKGVYHIGMSAVIYSLAGFLFMSGILRKYFPLQALSLLIVFLYGSMVWGLFPTNLRISWEGHLMGLSAGIFLAIYYRSMGPQRPKFQYEIEKELGIEPPDLEAIYNQKLREEAEREAEIKSPQQIIYHYLDSKEGKDKAVINPPSDETVR